MATTGRRDIVLDGMFPLPPGVIDVRHENLEDSEFVYDVEDVADTAPVLEVPTDIIPVLPLTAYQIVDQTIRITSDGRSVVDVTFEFPDTPGINSVNVKETKL